MSTYKCIERKIKANGEVISYILENELKQRREFTRDAVLLLMHNSENQFTNLKLTLDNRIKITSTVNKIVTIDKPFKTQEHVELAILISKLADKKTPESTKQEIYNQLKINPNAIRYYSIQLANQESQDRLKEYTQYSKSIQVQGLYRDDIGKVIGYKIINKGNHTLTYKQRTYTKSNKGLIPITEQTKLFTIDKSININVIDTIDLICQFGHGGNWSNAVLKPNITTLLNNITNPSKQPYLSLPHSLCYIDTNVKELKYTSQADEVRRELMISMGENISQIKNIKN